MSEIDTADDLQDFLEIDEDKLPRLGVLGGTFDPPHVGHLILAETAMNGLGLERVIFVPAAEPPHKQDRPLTPAAQRFAMLERAIAGNPRFSISRIDMDRPGPHYTADMLGLLRQQNPSHNLYFLMGADSLNDLSVWRAPAWIIAQAQIAVMRRTGTVINLDALAAKLPGIRDRVTFVDAPTIDISATALRDTVRAGLSIRYQVPDTVLEYINKYKLYAGG